MPVLAVADSWTSWYAGALMVWLVRWSVGTIAEHNCSLTHLPSGADLQVMAAHDPQAAAALARSLSDQPIADDPAPSLWAAPDGEWFPLQHVERPFQSVSANGFIDLFGVSSPARGVGMGDVMSLVSRLRLYEMR